MSARAACWIAAVLALAHAASFLGAGPFDDDYICYRYARSLVDGHGLVFQPGERVEGFTNPLWVLVLAAGMLARLEPVGVSLALSVLSCGVAAWAVGDLWRARHPGSRWCGPALLVAGSPAIAWHGVAGLGTTAFAALLALWLRSWERARVAGDTPWAAGAWLALACLLRQEAALFAVAFALVEARGRGRLAAALPLAALAAWTLVRLGYYGRLLPMTWTAKKLPLAADLGYGARYLLLSTLETGIGLALLAVAFAPRAVEAARRPTTRAAALAVLAYAAWVVAVGGDFVAYARFFVPVLPLAALLACEGASVWIASAWRRWTLGVLALAALQWTQVGAPVSLGRLDVGVGRRYRFADHAWNEERWIRMGRHLGSVLPPDTVVALSPIGAFGWHSELPIVDLLGLTNESALGVEPMLDTVAMKGHHRVHPDWVLDRAPQLVILGNGHRDPANGRPSVNPWEAPLVLHPRFQREYEQWVVPIPADEPLDVFLRRGAPPPEGAWRR